jgi:pyrrolidone-carboxylate peptidase
MKRIIVISFLIFSLFSLWGRRNIMMTGYWPPTSEMIYLFSDDQELNPDGWIGENWEDSGYDVYAFFPAFNRHTRDFEVDYQATWEDFWATVDIYNPIAIISYGAGAGPWEIEYNARNLSNWVNDYEYPFQPTPCPPDSTVPPNFVRHSTLPVSQIETAVDNQTPINAWVDWNGNPGSFLCEYMAYLGMWYQDSHSNPEDEFPCLAAGFIHVSSGINLAHASDAAIVTLQTVIDYLHDFVDVSGSVYLEDGNSEGTEISLVNDNGTEYNAIADEYGNFSINLLPSGDYHLTAILGRYYYYEAEVQIDFQNNFLEIVLEEYQENEHLSWCNDPLQLVSSTPGIHIMIAAVFEPEDLAPYINCHLRELNIVCGVDSSQANIELILYKGTPDGSSPMLILKEEFLSGFTAGNQHTLWLDDLNILDDSSWETGITLGFMFSSDTGDLAYMDEGPAVNGKGNMIKVSGQWMQASDMLGADGNWAIGLGFYGTPISEQSSDIITYNNKLMNYPNPFNPQTTIRFELASAEKVNINIYNIKGELIRALVNSEFPAGKNEVSWNGRNEQGKETASGIYLYKFYCSEYEHTGRMVLLK